MTSVKAVFVELPAFDSHRGEYLSDEAFRMLQATLMKSPEAGDPIEAPVACASFVLLKHDAARANAAPCG